MQQRRAELSLKPIINALEMPLPTILNGTANGF
jgi:hypothetical protein